MKPRSKYSLLNQLNELQNMASIMNETYRAKAFRHAYLEVLKVKNLNKRDLMNLDVGTRMKEKFNEFMSSGEISEIKTKKEDPQFLAMNSLHTIAGVGSKLVEKWIQLGVTDIPSLEAAIAEGKIKLNHMQTIGLKYHDDLNSRIPRYAIDELSKSLDDIRSLADKLEIAGSYRRGKDESGDIDIIIVTDNFAKIIETIKSRNDYVDTMLSGDERFSWLCKGSHGKVMQVDILNVPLDSYIYSLLYFTGSAYFNEYMRGAARSAGLKLNQHGLYMDGNPISCDSEEEIFKQIGIKFVPINKR